MSKLWPKLAIVLIFVQWLGACDRPKLTQEEAEKLVAEDTYLSTTRCAVHLPLEKEWSAGDKASTCAQSLHRAGLANVTESDALAPNGDSLTAQFTITKSERSGLFRQHRDKTSLTVEFECSKATSGRVSLLRQVGEDHATAQIEKIVTLDTTLLSSISTCDVEKPEVRTKQVHVDFYRNSYVVGQFKKSKTPVLKYYWTSRISKE